MTLHYQTHDATYEPMRRRRLFFAAVARAGRPSIFAGPGLSLRAAAGIATRYAVAAIYRDPLAAGLGYLQLWRPDNDPAALNKRSGLARRLN